jgi:hypothetical protein
VVAGAAITGILIEEAALSDPRPEVNAAAAAGFTPWSAGAGAGGGATGELTADQAIR